MQGQCFVTEKLDLHIWQSGGNRLLQFWNNIGRGRSRDQLFCFVFLFSFF